MAAPAALLRRRVQELSGGIGVNCLSDQDGSTARTAASHMRAGACRCAHPGRRELHVQMSYHPCHYRAAHGASGVRWYRWPLGRLCQNPPGYQCRAIHCRARLRTGWTPNAPLTGRWRPGSDPRLSSDAGSTPNVLPVFVCLPVSQSRDRSGRSGGAARIVNQYNLHQ